MNKRAFIKKSIYGVGAIFLIKLFNYNSTKKQSNDIINKEEFKEVNAALGHSLNYSDFKLN